VRAAFVIALGLSLGPVPATAQTAAQAEEIATPSTIRRIRAELERTSRLTFDVVDETPHFQMIISEPQRFREDTGFLFSTGPVPSGRRSAFKGRPQVGPQLATPLVVVDVMPVGRALVSAVQNARTARRRTAAREDVKRAIDEYCGAQPDRGADIQMCSISAAMR
jgi:hypothetical protein